MVARVVTARVPDAACPGALRAVPALDGLLARIRTPGGLVSIAQVRALAAIARTFGDGRIDITARASVQLRGIAAEALAPLGDALEAAGLLPSRSHDRVRNIVAPALTGFDPGELVDVAPLVRALDAAIVATPALADLPAKFAFGLDCGARGSLARGDLVLRAHRAGGRVVMSLAIGGRPSDVYVPPAAAARVLVRAALAAIEAARALGAPDRLWRLAELPAADARVVAAARAFGSNETPEPTSADIVQYKTIEPFEAAERPAAAARPLGALPSRNAGRAVLVPSVPLGRLTAAQLDALAALAEAARADVRLGPWRGVALCDIAHAGVDRAALELARIGLPLDGRDGFAGLAACAGIGGCAHALADVRGDARTIAGMRRGAATSPTLNLAGCAKRCGMRRGAALDLVATPEGYDVLAAGRLVRRGASSGDACRAALASADALAACGAT